MKTVIEMAREIAAQYSKAERFQTWTHDFMMQRLMDLVAASAADEREECAKVCEELQSPPDWNLVAVLWKECRSKLAAAIRARGNT